MKKKQQPNYRVMKNKKDNKNFTNENQKSFFFDDFLETSQKNKKRRGVRRVWGSGGRTMRGGQAGASWGCEGGNGQQK